MPHSSNNPRIAFVASASPKAREAAAVLIARYGDTSLDEAELIVALGGDGFMLRTLHDHLDRGLPVYGMKLGRVGFLMNQFEPDSLRDRVAAAHPAVLHPLEMRVVLADGKQVSALAFNEVSLLRQTNQAAHVEVALNGAVKLENLICDGVLVATPAGSTAYNLSVQGPIIPVGAPLLALTPISPFRPRHQRGVLLPDTATVTIEVLESERRPVAAVADHDEVRSVTRVDIRRDPDIAMRMLFDPGHNLDERILREQFVH